VTSYETIGVFFDATFLESSQHDDLEDEGDPSDSSI